jgi:hypothetical protein
MRIRVAVAVGLALLALGLVATLSHAPALTVPGAGVLPETQFVATSHPASGCQSGEALPPRTVAIRLGLFAVTTPAVAVRVLTPGGGAVTSGALGPGWSGEGAVVPVRPVLAHAVAPVTVCFSVRDVNGAVAMVGRKTSGAEATVGGGQRLPGRISVQYLQPGHRSWWSLALSVARRLGLGRTDPGTWNALLVALLAAGVLGLSAWLVVRDLA